MDNRGTTPVTAREYVMSRTSVARDTATATTFLAFLAAIERNPSGWRWPASNAAYLQHRIETLAADMLQTCVTGTDVVA